jgi:hypothetical protein
VAIELFARAQRGLGDQALLTLTAEPAKLTADGRSTSRIRAQLSDFGGQPLSGERVAFSLGNDNGRVRILQATTDAGGVAEAEYRAGTLAGTVTVTASVADLGVTASVQIVLMADGRDFDPATHIFTRFLALQNREMEWMKRRKAWLNRSAKVSEAAS